MRIALSLVLAASLTLLACDRSGGEAQSGNAGEPGAATTTAQNSKDAITGNLVTQDGAPAQLPEGAVVTVRLLDGTRSDAPPSEILTQIVPSSGALPMAYVLNVDRKSVERMATYLVDANVTLNGQLLFLTQSRVPVLTQGAGRNVDIPLLQGLAVTAPETDAEAAKRLYADLETQLGAMKRLVGDRIVGDVTIGWDAFADNTGVRMVRENVDYGEEGGKAALKYAYRDGKPWVAIKEQGGASTMVAWDKFGNVVLREVTRNAAASEATEGVAAELKRKAEEVYGIAAAKL